MTPDKQEAEVTRLISELRSLSEDELEIVRRMPDARKLVRMLRYSALTPTVPDDELRMVAAQRVYDTMDGRVGMLEAQMLVGIVAEALAQSKPTATEEEAHVWKDNDKGGMDNVTAGVKR